MENATKALIIAAAILIAIVLISLAVMVLGGGSQMVKDNSDMSGTEVTAFNSKWEAYCGKISGSKFKQLVNAVNQNNRIAEDASKQVAIDASAVTKLLKGKSTTEYTLDTGFRAGDSYNVSVKAYRNSGLIDQLEVKK